MNFKNCNKIIKFCLLSILIAIKQNSYSSQFTTNDSTIQNIAETHCIKKYMEYFTTNIKDNFDENINFPGLFTDENNLNKNRMNSSKDNFVKEHAPLFEKLHTLYFKEIKQLLSAQINNKGKQIYQPAPSMYKNLKLININTLMPSGFFLGDSIETNTFNFYDVPFWSIEKDNTTQYADKFIMSLAADRITSIKPLLYWKDSNKEKPIFLPTILDYFPTDLAPYPDPYIIPTSAFPYYDLIPSDEIFKKSKREFDEDKSNYLNNFKDIWAIASAGYYATNINMDIDWNKYSIFLRNWQVIFSNFKKSDLIVHDINSKQALAEALILMLNFPIKIIDLLIRNNNVAVISYKERLTIFYKKNIKIDYKPIEIYVPDILNDRPVILNIPDELSDQAFERLLNLKYEYLNFQSSRVLEQSTKTNNQKGIKTEIDRQRGMIININSKKTLDTIIYFLQVIEKSYEKLNPNSKTKTLFHLYSFAKEFGLFNLLCPNHPIVGLDFQILDTATDHSHSFAYWRNIHKIWDKKK